jgi:signal transduction histidine kinase
VSLVTRLTWWFAGLLVLALSLDLGISYYEFFVENHPQREPLWVQFTEVALMSLVPLVLLGIGAWWLSFRAVRPLRKLTDAASRIHDRNLREPIPQRGTGDEVDRLTTVFNDMTARLATSFDRIREFTLRASHELKTPLAILRADFGELVDEPARSEADRARFTSHLDEIERLTRIVDNLTLLTKADAQMLKLEQLEVRLDDLVREAAEDTRALGESRNLRVECEVAPVTVRGDRHRLRQLLLILCDNAVKYNRDGGEISLWLGADAILRVRNTGAGIPAAEQPHVFQRFYRGSAAPAADIEGSGLGLSIAQWIVQAHGGTLTFTSDTRHTEFVCQIPLA